MNLRIDKRLDEIMIFIPVDGQVDLDKLIQSLKLLESDFLKASKLSEAVEAESITKFQNVLIKIIQCFVQISESCSSVQTSQKLSSATQVLFRLIYPNLSLLDYDYSDILFLVKYIENHIFLKVIDLYDLIITAGILWVSLQTKIKKSSTKEIIENIVNFPLSARIACLNGFLIDSQSLDAFHEIYGLDKHFFLKHTPENQLYEPGFLVVRSRYCFSLSQILWSNGTHLDKFVARTLFNCLLSSVLERLESPIEAVRLCSFDCLKNLLHYDDRFGDGELIRNLLSESKSDLDDCKGSFFRTICVVLQVIGAERALAINPLLIERTMDFIKDRNDMPSCIHDILSQLCIFNIEKFFHVLASTHPKSSFFVVDQVFSKLFKKEPKIIDGIIQLDFMNFPNLGLKVKLKLVHLLSSIANYSLDDIEKILEKALFNLDDQIKLQAASILIESKKLSCPLSEVHLHLILEFIQGNLDHEEPYIRQNFLNLFGKLLTRIKCSLDFSARTGKEDLSVRYNFFFQKLFGICFRNLYIDSYFAQRFIVLNLALTAIRSFENLESLKISEIFVHFSSEFIFESLFLCILEDTLEETKDLAIKLAVELFNYQVIIVSAEEEERIRKCAFLMVQSINPVNILTATYLFKFFASIISIKGPKKMDLICLELIEQLLQDTEKAVEKANKSLLYGAALDPIHSRLTAIYGLLKCVEVAEINDEIDQWKQVIQKVMRLVFESCQCVKSIVCNDSPEGHLPMDFQSIDDETMSSILKKENLPSSTSIEKRRNITSQMLLIFGWKTIKESSGILGLLCERFKHDPQESSRTIINCRDMQAIVEFFVHHLMNLKHRGAFEQAYIGFAIVVKELLKKNCPCIILIDDLLRNILQSIANEDVAPLKVQKCITRRSAGLPFVIQALLTANPAGIASHSFGSVIQKLISICNNTESQEWQKIHCINVLRALEKDYRLADYVGPFVEDCLQVCLQSFSANSYSIQNSTSLLFSTTMNKIFGINRGKDFHHKKNAMSAKHFFLLFPSMQNVFATTLRSTRDHRLIPVLLILLRLWPSAREGDPLLLDLVDPLFEICTSSVYRKVRDLSAQVSAQICSFDLALSHCLVEKIDRKLSSDFSPTVLQGCFTILHHSISLNLEKDDKKFFDLIKRIVNHHVIVLECLVTKFKVNCQNPYPFGTFKRLVSSAYLLLKKQALSEKDNIAEKINFTTTEILELCSSSKTSHGFYSSHDFVVEMISFTLSSGQPKLLKHVLRQLMSWNLPIEMVYLRSLAFRFLSDSINHKTGSFSLMEKEILLDYELDYFCDKPIVGRALMLFSAIELKDMISACPEVVALASINLNEFEPSRNVQQLLLVMHQLSLMDPEVTLKIQKNLVHKLFEDSAIDFFTLDETLALSLLFVADLNLVTTQSSIFEKFSAKVLQLCDAARSDLSRSIALNILEKLLIPFLDLLHEKKVSTSSFLSFFNLWSSFLKLILDNERVIRDPAIALLYRIRKTFNLADLVFHQSKVSIAISTLVDCVKNTKHDYRSIYQEILFTQLFDLLFSQQSMTSCEDGGSERLFDKSKLNLFDDPIMMMSSLTERLLEIAQKNDCNFIHRANSPVIKNYIPADLKSLPAKVISLLSEIKIKRDRVSSTPISTSLLELQKYLYFLQIWAHSNRACASCNSVLRYFKDYLSNSLPPMPVYIMTQLRLLIKSLNQIEL